MAKSRPPSKSGKALLKSKLRLQGKQLRAKIAELNQQTSDIADLHAQLVKKNPRQINVLDSKMLKAGLAQDEKTKKQAKLAEKDLAAQMDLISDMSIGKEKAGK